MKEREAIRKREKKGEGERSKVKEIGSRFRRQNKDLGEGIKSKRSTVQGGRHGKG